MGNQLSHLQIWHEIVDKKLDVAVIMQDDALLVSDFNRHVMDVIRSLPADSYITWIGLHWFAFGSYSMPWPLEDDYDPDQFSSLIEPGNPYIGKGNGKFSPHSLAYVITQQGASALVEHFTQHGFHRATDETMNQFLEDHDRQHISRKVLCTGAKRFERDSDVFRRTDSAKPGPGYGK